MYEPCRFPVSTASTSVRSWASVLPDPSGMVPPVSCGGICLVGEAVPEVALLGAHAVARGDRGVGLGVRDHCRSSHHGHSGAPPPFGFRVAAKTQPVTESSRQRAPSRPVSVGPRWSRGCRTQRRARNRGTSRARPRVRPRTHAWRSSDTRALTAPAAARAHGLPRGARETRIGRRRDQCLAGRAVLVDRVLGEDPLRDRRSDHRGDLRPVRVGSRGATQEQRTLVLVAPDDERYVAPVALADEVEWRGRQERPSTSGP